jgi:hypothetical protein
MCVYADRIQAGELPGPYSDQQTEHYARSALIDDDEFNRSNNDGTSDQALAKRFNVPVEQVRAKRADPHDSAWAATPRRPGPTPPR